jgi:hypothetical protein
MTQAYTQRFTEVHELGPVANPDVVAIGVHASPFFNLANHQRAVVILLVGDMQAGATVDMQLWQATTQAGANAKIIAGKAITQLTQAGGDGNDSLIVEVRTEELDVDGGFTFVNAIITVAGDTVELASLALLGCSNYSPVATTRWTEIVD